MVAHLVRCQLDPAMPRPSIETLLHAFVPAAHVHHTHPDGINILAGSRARRAARARVLRRLGRLDPVHPPGLHALEAGRRGGAEHAGPASVVVLAKHGLVVWGDTAEEAYHRTIEAINTAIAFVNERTHGQAALRRSGGVAARRRDPARDADAAAAGDPRRALVGAREAALRRRVAEGARIRLVAGRAGARRGRGALSRPPRPHQAGSALDPVRPRGRRRRARRGAHPRRRRGLPRRLSRVRRGVRAAAPRRWIPTRASCSCSTSASSGSGRRWPPRASRAISTTARWRSWRARTRSTASSR